jgi:hypothetical protein
MDERRAIKCSEAAAFMVGHALVIDGGQTVQCCSPRR